MCNQDRDPQARQAAWERHSWLLDERIEVLWQPTKLNPILALVYGATKARLSVLAELGRISCDLGKEAFRRAVDELIDVRPKPSTKAAVAMLRRWRLECLGKSNEDRAGDARGVFDAIDKALEGYLDRCPATSKETIVEALEDMIGIYLWFIEEEAEDNDGAGPARGDPGSDRGKEAAHGCDHV
jgi:hypothetical protein